MNRLEITYDAAEAVKCLNDWYRQYCVPVVQAIYVNDDRLARSLLAQATDKLDSGDFSEDTKEALRYRLRYIQWQIDRICQAPGQAELEARCVRDELSRPATGPIADIVRNNVLMQMRTTCLRDDILDYPDEEFELHYSAVDEEFRTLEFWHYVSTWAFLNRQQHYLEKALEVHTIHADGFMSDFLWQRINLMLLMLQGRASKLDVIELIKRIDNVFQWRNVEKVIWPACQKAGLVDLDIEQRLEAQLGRIGSQPPKAPVRDRSTKALIYR